MSFSTVQLAGAGVTVAFALGLVLGNFQGRGAITAKWNKTLLATEQNAGELESFSGDVEEEQEDRVEEGKEEQREEDTVSRTQYIKLERKLSSERSYFEGLLAAERSKGGECNCINLDMPVELQRRPSLRTSSPTESNQSYIPGTYPGGSARDPALRGSGRD